MAPGYVVSSRATDDVRVVTQVVPDSPGRCRMHWSRDVLPDEAAQPLSAAMNEAAPIIKRALESAGGS